MHVLISSMGSEFSDDWKPLLARLGANVSCRSKGKLDKTLRFVDVVLVNEEYNPKTIIKVLICHYILISGRISIYPVVGFRIY